MTKLQLLDIVMLLSALESWALSQQSRLPCYLTDRINDSINVLTEEILKNP